MITPRQAFLTLEYDGKDISSDIRKDVENFTYTDSGSDSSDSLSIKVNAIKAGPICAKACWTGWKPVVRTRPQSAANLPCWWLGAGRAAAKWH